MESELVSGFFTEHSSVPFVSFFLAEYGSILLISILTAILFLGGYHFPFFLILKFINDFIWIFFDKFNSMQVVKEQLSYLLEFNPIITGILNSLVLGVKASFIVFCFVWARASMPRIRYDQLMQFCWTVLLPLLFAFIFLVPCLLYSFDSLPISLLVLPLNKKFKININFPYNHSSYLRKKLRRVYS